MFIQNSEGVMSYLLVTIPHSGEKVPVEATWLQNLPEEILMCDVDRYVDRLYEPALQKLNIPSVKTEWHRYVVDLNRDPSDVDANSLEGATGNGGQFKNRGYHWVETTLNHQLMPKPLTKELHNQFTGLIYKPFHQKIAQEVALLRKKHHEVFHIDAHSMPSVGTKMHRDPGEYRADIVVSDQLGKSCKPEFRDLVIAAYCIAGFKVGYNWPYIGGRVTEQYGNPQQQHHTIQVELNRALYMDEKTKKIKETESQQVQEKLEKALSYILSQLPV
jgi:N-formylglutamate amidohydrolase